MDPSGNLTASRSYDVYGSVRGGQAGTSKHKFVGALGHPSEDETGLIYMRARYMDPQIGRFVSEDPAGDGTNWFSYCAANPVNFSDPSGKKVSLIILGFIAGFVFGIWQDLRTGYFSSASIGKALSWAGVTTAFELGAMVGIEYYASGTLGALTFGEELLSGASGGIAAVAIFLTARYAGICAWLCYATVVEEMLGMKPNPVPDIPPFLVGM